MTVRERVVNYLRNRLVGPIDGIEEKLDDDPMNIYTAGILHPRDYASQSGPPAREDSNLDEDNLVSVTDSGTDESSYEDDPLVLASQHYPSVIGVSFLVSGKNPLIHVDVGFAVYEKIDKKFTRKQFQKTINTRVHNHPQGATIEKVIVNSHDLMDGRAKLSGIFRRQPRGWLVTVVLINSTKTKSKGNVTDKLFQPTIACQPCAGCAIQQWPRPRAVAGGSEVETLEMVYRHRKVYAVGHGCAAQWDASAAPPPIIRSEIMPTFEVPITSFQSGGTHQSRALRIAWLAGDPSGLIDELDKFVEKYVSWIGELDGSAEAREAAFARPRTETLAAMRRAATRMHAGVAVLRDDALARRAFCLASRAMLAQMQQTARYRDRPRDANLPSPPQIVSPDPEDSREWRPFQLAFQLLVLKSLVEPNADVEPNRAVVDLLWFPTGGGKTEAYLALAAFELFYRRLRYGSRGGGTAVIMRYSLRLLTAQQFQRATALICAIELLRRKELPDEPPITIGLWVGESQTPNSVNDAEQQRKDHLLNQSPPRNPFVIDRCGWCGTHLVPANGTSDENAFGFRIVGDGEARRLEARCVRPDCPFHDRLPVVLIDEDIYRTPPSFLLGTLDKFARLAWVADAGIIFGAGSDHRPPSLIIQDELHLINGPVGTIAGVYEAAFEELASRPGLSPKVIASTATIRSASSQVRALYGRDVAVFPPTGLNASDSYFARDDDSKPGRLFVGVFSDSHSGQMVVARLLAALLHAPDALGLRGQERDAYWTLVGYHNSLRELGRVMTLASDDVPNWIRTFGGGKPSDRQFVRGFAEELTSNQSGAELVQLLDRLGRRYDDPGQISMLLATNMFSVGVDIDRLGLMFVNGQPKVTSEYIQATSRIGRSSVPGLVVTYYGAPKPRDRSHYERFQSYHQALYREVEPMSVTPFAEPARRRALHAALVIIVRHRLGLAANDRACDFGRCVRPTPEYAAAKTRLLDRVRCIDPSEYEGTKDILESFEADWAEHSAGQRLRYYTTTNQFSSLLSRFEDTSPDGVPTLNSMRNVDKSVVIENLERRQGTR